MTGIAAVLNTRGGLANPVLLDSLAGAMGVAGGIPQTFGDGPFQCVSVSAPLGRQAAIRRSSRGVCVVSTSRLDGRVPGTPRDTTDADFLLLAYDKWSTELVEHIIGDFGFIVWDPHEKRLIAATDQFGVCPMFHTQIGDHLIISNRLAAIRDSGCVDTELNDAVVGDMLTLGFSSDHRSTIYSAVSRLAPAHRLISSKGASRLDRYWMPPSDNAPLMYRSVVEYADHFRDVLFSAVADRLPTHGPIGILLSGGLDSTAVAAAARYTLGADASASRVTGYTTVFRDIPEEEGSLAAQVVAQLGIRGKHSIAEDHQFRPLPTHWAHVPPEPGSIPEISPSLDAATELSQAGGTLLNGLGGDVLFMAPRTAWTGTIRSSGWRAPLTVARYVGLFGELPRTGLRTVITRHIRPIGAVVPPWIDASFAVRTNLVSRMEDYRSVTSRPGLRRLVDPFWSHIVSMGDSGHTGISIEHAHPYFDVRLAELTSRLPEPLLQGKRILREAMVSFLPAAILSRRKTPLGLSTLAARRHPAVIARTDALIGRVPDVARFVDVAALRRCNARPTAETAHLLSWAENFCHWWESTLAANAIQDII